MSHHYFGPDFGSPHAGNRMNLPDAPVAREGFFVTYFFTVKDQEKSKDFYVRILGGKVINPENPCYIKLANSWIVLNSGGGPTPDKPEVLLETPQDLNRVDAFLNLRVADIWSCYKQWRAKGAFFLSEPLDNRGWEWRCYMRDPDGYLIEIGQYTQLALDHFEKYAVEFAGSKCSAGLILSEPGFTSDSSDLNASRSSQPL